ncbi:hypothetical protein N9K67_00780 [Opitutaceae bacterium]|nr:hypothetical protein [Opitutaceae bacterium]
MRALNFPLLVAASLTFLGIAPAISHSPSADIATIFTRAGVR